MKQLIFSLVVFVLSVYLTSELLISMGIASTSYLLANGDPDI